MNTNSATEKQLDYIDILRKQSDGQHLLLACLRTYSRMQERGRLPSELNIDEMIYRHVIIPAHGPVTPSDLFEMEKNFDAYVAQYTPETIDDASALIDVYKGINVFGTPNKLVMDWLTKNYVVTEKNGTFYISK